MSTRKQAALVLAAVGLGALGARELPAAWDELMGTRVVKAEDLRAVEGVEGTIRTYFDAPTSTLLNLGMRAATLPPGATPHPTRPHARSTETILLVKEGTLEIRLDERSERTERLEEGSVVFMAPHQWHSLHNPGAVPATYYEIAWTSPGMNGEPEYPQDAVNWRRRR